MSAIDELFSDRRGTDPYISALAVRVTGLYADVTGTVTLTIFYIGS